MSLVINTNVAATSASFSLNKSNGMLQGSLQRLSSGFKINSPADDAGGLAVSMKMQAAIKRTDAVNVNVNNAVSYLQTQDGALDTSSKILDRISELRTLNDDVTKNSNDKANYESEFDQLKSQLTALSSEQFNGVSVFGSTDLTVNTTEDGQTSVTLTGAQVTSTSAGFGNITAAADLTNIGSIGVVTDAIQNVATLRATNGSLQSRLSFSSDMLNINKTNLEAANSRIIDTDIADESTKFARYQILQQSGAAMLAQANASSQIALRLLG